MIWSSLSSALKTTSVPELDSRLLSFIRTVAELRPPRLYSVRSTTIGSLPCMMTLPARISCAIFITVFRGRCKAARKGTEVARVPREPSREKPMILACFGDETQQLSRQVGLSPQRVAPGGGQRSPGRQRRELAARGVRRVPQVPQALHRRAQRRVGAGQQQIGRAS